MELIPGGLYNYKYPQTDYVERIVREYYLNKFIIDFVRMYDNSENNVLHMGSSYAEVELNKVRVYHRVVFYRKQWIQEYVIRNKNLFT